MQTYVEGFHQRKSVEGMQYNQLGNTDLIVSKLSLGSTPFGDWYNKCDQEIVDYIVTNGLKHGINFIDTAYWYGQGKAEERLGKVLRNIPRSAYYIATKVGRYELDKENMFNFRAEKTLKSVEHSLSLLKLPSVDLLQVHDVEYGDEKLILEETLPALQKLKDLGKTRYIGITGYSLQTLKSIIEKSSVPIDTILTYCRATLNDNSLKDYIDEFKKKNLGIINAGALSCGLLTPQGPPYWHPAPEKIKIACRDAVNYCNDTGFSAVKLGLKYSMNYTGVDTTLVGLDRKEMLAECLESATTQLTKQEFDVIEEIKRKFFDGLSISHWEGSELKLD